MTFIAADFSTKFKNSNGVYLMRDLFYETASDKERCLYTLKDQEHEGLPSLYRLYIQHCSSDPTEYTFATSCFDGWEHWKALSSSSFLSSYVAKWREEIEIKLRATALSQIIRTAKAGGRDALAASRYLTEGYGDKKKVGRPTKEQVKEKLDTADKDYLRLIKING